MQWSLGLDWWQKGGGAWVKIKQENRWNKYLCAIYTSIIASQWQSSALHLYFCHHLHDHIVSHGKIYDYHNNPASIPDLRTNIWTTCFDNLQFLWPVVYSASHGVGIWESLNQLPSHSAGCSPAAGWHQDLLLKACGWFFLVRVKREFTLHNIIYCTSPGDDSVEKFQMKIIKNLLHVCLGYYTIYDQ